MPIYKSSENIMEHKFKTQGTVNNYQQVMASCPQSLSFVSCRDERDFMAVFTFSYKRKEKSFPHKMTKTV